MISKHQRLEQTIAKPPYLLRRFHPVTGRLATSSGHQRRG